MTAAEISALCTGIPAVLTAIGVLIAQVRHAGNPAAHSTPPPH